MPQVVLEYSLNITRKIDSAMLLGEDCLEYLEEYFPPYAGELSLQMTVEIRDMEKEAYFKSVPGKQGQGR